MIIETFFLSVKPKDKLSPLLTCLMLDLKHIGITFKWILNKFLLLFHLCKVQLLAKFNAD